MMKQVFSGPFGGAIAFMALACLTLSRCDCDLKKVDVKPVSMEITQAIQTTSNSVQLIAERSTAVRVTVDAGPDSVCCVTGLLHVFVNGTEITPSGGISPVNTPFTAVPSPDRAVENHTLNFELPAPTGITASSDVDFKVNLIYLGDTDASNNEISVNDLDFNNPESDPQIRYVRVDYTPSGLGLPPVASIQAGVGDQFVKGIYPINDDDANLYNPSTFFPTLSFSEDTDGDNILDGNATEGSELLAVLSAVRSFEVLFAGMPSDNSFVYGWINGNPISGNGLGTVGGVSAYGNTQDIRHQRTFAHELGHNFGLNHNSRTLSPEVGWDVGARLDGNPATNNTTGRVKIQTLNDIMVGGVLTNNAWIDITTYNFFMGVVEADDAGGSPDEASRKIQPQQKVAYIRGALSPDGSKVDKVWNVWRFPHESGYRAPKTEGQFTLEIKDTKGAVYTAKFDAQVCVDSEKETMEYGFFDLEVPVNAEAEIAAMRILDGKGKEMRSLRAPNSGKVNIRGLQPGMKLGNDFEVAWDFTGPQTTTFLVLMSGDGGESWRPLSLEEKGRSIKVNAKELGLKPSQNATIRVFASDGLVTKFSEVSGLNTEW